jgi:formylglycine-generating enzyme
MKFKLLWLSPVIFLLFFSGRKQAFTIYDLRYIEENLCYIPKQSFQTGPSDQDVDYNSAAARTVSVDSFFLFRYEVTNGMYRFYLKELLRRGAGTAVYNAALPDTLVWREKLAYNEPYVEYYLRHPAYSDYPLVGVSYEQAIRFCDSISSWYNAWPDRKYKKVKFDLPSEDQWTAAARGGLQLSPFPWGGPYMQNAKGQWLANFTGIDQGSVYRDTIDYINVYGRPAKRVVLAAHSLGSRMGTPGSLDDYSDVTAPVKSFTPNGYGLYNMSGNVEEMVREKGITKGGSWSDTGYYLLISAQEYYTDSSAVTSSRGFRIMMSGR